MSETVFYETGDLEHFQISVGFQERFSTMAKKEKPCFVFVAPLYVDSHAYKVLHARFNVAHHIYNCFLGECEKRRKKYQALEEYKQAKNFSLLKYAEKEKLAKTQDIAEIKKINNEIKELTQKATELYAEARKQAGFYLGSSKPKGLTNSLEVFAANTIEGTWLSEHIDSHSRNKLMERAFTACRNAVFSKPKVRFKKFNKDSKPKKGKKPKVHFKKFNKDYIYSVEGKSFDSSLKIRKIQNQFYILWKGLKLPLIVKKDDIKYQQMDKLYEQTIAEKSEALEKITFVRLKRKLVGNKWEYFADIMCGGKPIKKEHQVCNQGIIGLDIGPSTIAYASDVHIELREIFSELTTKKAFVELSNSEKFLDRKVDRQRRQNNPQNYNSNGTVVKGSKKWKISKRMRLTERKRDDLRRRIAEMRKQAINLLAWYLRSQGDVIRVDADKYKTWQEIGYGKSIGKHSPGLLIATIEKVFTSTGGRVEKINTRESKSSQTCPNCGKIQKKGLSEGKDNRSIRIHECECGFKTQRDVASALINKFFENSQFDLSQSTAYIIQNKLLLRNCIQQVLKLAPKPGTFGAVADLRELLASI